MRPLRQRFRELAAELLDVPPDATMDVPRVILIGTTRLLVENYRTLVEFSPSSMRLRLAEGELIVEGRDLSVHTILQDEIIIQGVVRAVRYA